jgi:co-chaperonin GroES (HSP10)
MEEHMIQPILDYCLAKKVMKDSGAVYSTDVSDTHQLFEIIAIGEGRYDSDGILIPMPVQIGDTVWIQKHSAEGDTPKDLESQGLALFMASRVMAKEIK